ncbi:MAG TPA: tetratricopeptide repeat protein [Candidatus Methylacidiphilales bacterium]|nr:tetratricopeptide repeat protein [Candidatus Methylacidiphilales bacterium]
MSNPHLPPLPSPPQPAWPVHGLALILPATVIIVATAVIFWPVLQGDWLWDDDADITKNVVTQSASGLWSIWFQPGSQTDFYPVKSTVQWVQWHLWGNDTLGYHLTNLVLHMVGALLVWRLFHQLGLKLAWLGGLIFAVHPALVESVAWIAELKNTLSLPFFLLSAIFYLKFSERGYRRDYFLSLGLFLIAMLTKPSMAMWPAVLLLYAWWKRGRIGWDDWKTSAPFFAVSLLLGAVALMMAGDQTPGLVPLGGFFSRIALMGTTFAFYLSKTVWPVGLLPIYPQWPVNPPSPIQFLPWVALGGLLFWFWTKRKSWGRPMLFGFGFFLLMLLPFSGAVPISFMYITWVMDHFLYIPILGPIGLVIAGLEQASRQMPQPARYGGIGLLAAILIALIATSRAYAAKFVSQEVLWNYTLAINPNCWGAYDNLGNAFLHQGKADEAITQYKKALGIDMNLAEVHYNLGVALIHKREMDDAISQFQKALELNPNYADAHNNLGNALSQKGQVDDAIIEYQKALKVNPRYPEAQSNLGLAFLQKGRVDDAIVQLQKAAEADPTNTTTHYLLGNALLQKGRLDEAIAQLQNAAALDPGNADVHNSLGVALAQSGRMNEAIIQFEDVVQLKPGDSGAQYNLARAQTLARQKTNPN